MRYPRGERGSSANKFVMDGCTPIKVMYNYYECVCVCVCMCVCWPLPSNQSFYRQITGYKMGGGDHVVHQK